MFMRLASAALLLSMIPVLGGCGGGLSSLLGVAAAPSISGISPNPAVRGSAITVTGSNLNGTSTTVFFVLSSGGSSSQIPASSGTTTSVTASVPSGIPAGTYSIYVETSDTSGDVSQPSNVVTISLT